MRSKTARNDELKEENMELTADKQKALADVRKVMCERLEKFGFTEEMLKDKALLQLLALLELMVGHRNFVGQFTQTWIVLEELFGTDAFWDKPKIEPEKTEESETPVPETVVH
jgi:hypothetical protein